MACYESLLGSMVMTADDSGLTGLWFAGERPGMEEYAEKEIPLFADVRRWLDVYFSGRNPGFSIPLHASGTEFQKEVWDILLTIPYGETMTYGEIAGIIAERKGIRRMAAQAVGGAVGHNRILIFIPCHRVIGANGNLVGFGGAMDIKVRLLELENAMKPYFYIPRNALLKQ